MFGICSNHQRVAELEVCEENIATKLAAGTPKWIVCQGVSSNILSIWKDVQVPSPTSTSSSCSGVHHRYCHYYYCVQNACPSYLLLNKCCRCRHWTAGSHSDLWESTACHSTCCGWIERGEWLGPGGCTIASCFQGKNRQKFGKVGLYQF